MLRLSFYSKLVWGSYTASIANTASKNIEKLICSMKTRFMNLPGGLAWNTVAISGRCS